MTSMTWPAAQSHERRERERRSDHGGRRGAWTLSRLTMAPFDLTFWLTAALLAAALLIGGASRENALQLMGLELLSLPLIPLALWRLTESGAIGGLKIPLVLLAAMIALPLLQLAPIPFELWRRLPGHAQLAEGLALAGALPAFRPLSLTPQITLTSLLALLVPTAMFLGASACSQDQRKLLAGLVVMAAALTLILGLFQVIDGPDSPLRFYATTNRDVAVGLFANRNHQAIFLLLALPLLAASIGDLFFTGQRRMLVLVLAALGLFGVVLVGVAVTRSRAGLLLTLPAVAGSLLLLWKGSGARRVRGAVVGVALIAALALTGVAIFALETILARFALKPGDDFRIEIWPSVAEAAQRFSPFGSGLGSFEQVYRSAEPVSLMDEAFVNHVHNDYLQTWFELGWPGVTLVAAVLVWLAWRCVAAWSQTESRRSNLALASSVVVVLLALHSVVDYPLRTAAVMVVLALASSALAAPRNERDLHAKGSPHK